jgi:hypothetical protein
MSDTKVNNEMIEDSGKVSSTQIQPNSVSSADISNASIVDTDISPSAAIALNKFSSPGSSSDFLKGDGSFGAVDLSAVGNNAFNIGVLGFKMAVNEGLTIFNLVDGVVDEFNSEGGIDTSENSNAAYESAADFYQNLSPTPGVAVHLGVDAVTFENPEHAPLVTVTSQEATFGAFGTQGSITFPVLTTTVEATMVGAGGAGNGNGAGGSGGSVQGTITNPSIAGATWDFIVGEGATGPQASTPQYTAPQIGGNGGFGGGASGAVGGGGGFTGIFDDEVTIIEGGAYNEIGYHHQPDSPSTYPDEGPGFADTVSPTNASEAVLIVGSGGAGENSNGAPAAQAGGGGFTAGTNGSGTFSVPTAGSGGTNASGGGADQEANGHQGSYPVGEISGGGPAEWTQESPHPDAIHFQGGGIAYPPYHYGGGGSGYHGGGGTADPGGYTGGAGGGAGYSNPTYVPTPSLEYETAVGSRNSHPAPLSVFDEAPYYTALPAPRQALFADGARGEGATNGATQIGGDGGILLVFDAGSPSTSFTLVSDTFTANSTPSTSRVVVFAELVDDLNTDVAISVTRDNTTYNSVSLTDTGYVSGSSGIKIYTGSTPLTGSASPQVQMRWKVTGSTLTGANKIHGVALQWA